MSQSLTPGVEQAVTLATTVTLCLPTKPVRTLVVYSSDVLLYLVTGVADGAALPSTGRRLLAAAAITDPIEHDISAYGAWGLAGSGSGTARVEVR